MKADPWQQPTSLQAQLKYHFGAKYFEYLGYIYVFNFRQQMDDLIFKKGIIKLSFEYKC